MGPRSESSHRTWLVVPKMRQSRQKKAPDRRCGAAVARRWARAAACGLGLALVHAASALPVNAVPAAGDSTEVGSALRREVRLATRTAPDSLTVGDRVTLEVIADVPDGCEVRFPERVEHGGPVDLVDLTVQPPASGQGAPPRNGAAPKSGTWVGRYTLAVFEVGDVVLPPWTIEVRRGSESVLAATDSIRLFVQSVLTDSLRQAGLQDLEPQVGLPTIPWLWILGGLVLVALIVWLVLRRRRRPRAAVVPIERIRPAHEVALEALRRLELEHLPIDGKFEAFYVRLSEILRRYLEDGFGVAALEETTEEILFDLDRHGFDRLTLKQVGELCNESDLVKFAKHEPTVEDCKRAIERVRDFVVGTAARSALAQSSATSTGTLGAAEAPHGSPAANDGPGCGGA